MLEIKEKRLFDKKTIEFNGRLDSMSVPEVLHKLENYIQDGERILVIDCTDLNYISSAGLRVFLKSNKQLAQAEGKIIFFKMSGNCFKVFSMTKLDKEFDFVYSLRELETLLSVDSNISHNSVLYGNTEFSIKELDAERGNLTIIGKENLLPYSGFSESDIVTVKSSEYKFATGIACAGVEKKEILTLFGEAAIINNNIFYYPAIKNSAVDFVFNINGSVDIDYYFLHGFGFNGNFKYLMKFKSLKNAVSLKEIVEAVIDISSSNLTGVVIIAESKGFMGLNMKKVPLIENKPSEGKSIFDEEQFFDWFDFPIEPSDYNNLVSSVGIVVKDKQVLSDELKTIFPKNDHFHFHSVIFKNSPLSHNIESFEKELDRISLELDVSKVQHSLGDSEFSYGMIGLIELNK